MSQRLISLNPDLRRLRDDGYQVAVVVGHLVVSHVPYVNAYQQVSYGILVSRLELSGDVTVKPGDHVAYFCGDYPCDQAGTPMTMLVIDGQPPHPVTSDLIADHTFSHKPTPAGSYADYYQKITTYIAILVAPAQALDPDATARTYEPVVDDDQEAVFNYIDTASSRAGISVAAGKLTAARVAVVGLGGTGAYILDLLAKTPARQIYLFDGDTFLQHNAFRAPGAPTIEELRRRPAKVDYLKAKYSAMHCGIAARAYYLDESNVAELDEMTFVFLAIDDGPTKEVIIRRLEHQDIPFIDVGMGIYEVGASLAGLVRTTVSDGPPAQRDAARAQISFGQSMGDNQYSTNIQIADLNALNAALAVIAWKTTTGFYHNLGRKPFSTYAIDTGTLINEDGA
jgi:hypothetical protein